MKKTLLTFVSTVLCVLEGEIQNKNLPESEVAVMYTGQKYTRADVISLLLVISALSKRIAARMQMADEKGGGHVKDERLIPDFG